MRGVEGGRPGLPPWLRKAPGCGTGSSRVGCRSSLCADMLCPEAKGCLGVPSLTAALEKAVGWVLCPASSAWPLHVGVPGA